MSDRIRDSEEVHKSRGLLSPEEVADDNFWGDLNFSPMVSKMHLPVIDTSVLCKAGAEGWFSKKEEPMYECLAFLLLWILAEEGSSWAVSQVFCHPDQARLTFDEVPTVLHEENRWLHKATSDLGRGEEYGLWPTLCAFVPHSKWAKHGSLLDP